MSEILIEKVRAGSFDIVMLGLKRYMFFENLEDSNL